MSGDHLNRIMRFSLSFLGWLIALHAFPQSNNEKKIIQEDAPAVRRSPEILTSGFIDVMNNGQVNASARFVRLSIGEPGKFYIPLSIYGGVSNNTFNGQPASLSSIQKNNDQLINQYI